MRSETSKSSQVRASYFRVGECLLGTFATSVTIGSKFLSPRAQQFRKCQNPKNCENFRVFACASLFRLQFRFRRCVQVIFGSGNVCWAHLQLKSDTIGCKFLSRSVQIFEFNFSRVRVCFEFNFVFAGSPKLYSGRGMFVGRICN